MNLPTVLLLGASRGIGFELATCFVRLGWRTLATARDAAGLQRLQALGCEALALDVTRSSSQPLLTGIPPDVCLDLAVYVAGVIDQSPAPESPAQQTFDHVMHTNVWGAMRLMPELLPRLKVSQGVLVCISSVMGSQQETQSPSAWLYRASKAALNMVVRSVQAAEPGVTAVAMHPGWVQTDMGGPQAPLTAAQSAQSLCKTLLRLCQQPQAGDKGAFYNHDGTPIAW